MPGTTLRVEQLTAGYGRQPIVFDVDATFGDGRITALLGPNGAGKSTLLKALFGLATIFHGSMLLDGQTISGKSARALVRNGVAYVPQVRNVFPSLTVRENLQIGTYVRAGGSLEHVLSAFPELGALMHRRAEKLSGGQRVMVAVARALMSNPRLLLLDEVSAGLSPRAVQILWRHIAELARGGVGLVIVEQNVQLALDLADDVDILVSGRVQVQASAAEVRAMPHLEELFLASAPSADSKGQDATGEAPTLRLESDEVAPLTQERTEKRPR